VVSARAGDRRSEAASSISATATAKANSTRSDREDRRNPSGSARTRLDHKAGFIDHR
jgi:hypothetical protein